LKIVLKNTVSVVIFYFALDSFKIHFLPVKNTKKNLLCSLEGHQKFSESEMGLVKNKNTICKKSNSSKPMKNRRKKFHKRSSTKKIAPLKLLCKKMAVQNECNEKKILYKNNF